MDQSQYKQTKTQRGLTYSYYFSSPAPGKPVLFFSHGFPSDSSLWRKQVAFFQPKGYGILPTDPKLYIGSGIAQDLSDILDAEKIAQVITVGHDWGSVARVSAYAFFGLGYFSPSESGPTDLVAKSLQAKEMLGYDIIAYQRFFIQPDAPALIEKNIDSFINLLYPETPEVWMSNVCVDGGARAWIESNKTTPLPSYMTPEDTERLRTSFLSGGLSAPLCWYKASLEKTNLEDDTSACVFQTTESLLNRVIHRGSSRRVRDNQTTSFCCLHQRRRRAAHLWRLCA
ncbi:Alpha/Beta hydrolase protein [Mycena leptocephala]|nr:Alpha/Beta hydrolase protein [Mycena leptocephala]